jgi:hypothetical protein
MFHVLTTDEMLEKNRQAYLDRITIDWQPVALARDLDEATDIIEQLESHRRNRLPEVLDKKLKDIVFKASW